MRPGAAGALAFAALVARALPAPAAAPELAGLTITWEAPAACPDRDALVARVAELVGERGGRQSHAPLDMRAVLTENDDGSYHAELHSTQDGAERTRRLDAPNCKELTEASAVVVALAFSPPTPEAGEAPPEYGEPRPPRAEPAKPPPGPDVHPAPLSDAIEPEKLPRPSSVRVGGEAGLALDFGTLANVSAGFAFGISGRYGRYFEHIVRLSVFPSRRQTVEGYTDRGADLSLVAGGLALCFAPTLGAFELAACGEIELGLLHADGFGTTEHFPNDAPWVAPGLGLRASYPSHGWLRATLTGDALFPTQHTEFVVTNAGVAWKLPVMAGRLGIFAEMIFL